MRFTVVIPARYASQRLPGKPLADLHGRPLVMHVCERARSSGATQVIVATDDERVRTACAAEGVDVQMTGGQHAPAPSASPKWRSAAVGAKTRSW